MVHWTTKRRDRWLHARALGQRRGQDVQRHHVLVSGAPSRWPPRRQRHKTGATRQTLADLFANAVTRWTGVTAQQHLRPAPPIPTL